MSLTSLTVVSVFGCSLICESGIHSGPAGLSYITLLSTYGSKSARLASTQMMVKPDLRSKYFISDHPFFVQVSGFKEIAATLFTIFRMTAVTFDRLVSFAGKSWPCSHMPSPSIAPSSIISKSVGSSAKCPHFVASRPGHHLDRQPVDGCTCSSAVR